MSRFVDLYIEKTVLGSLMLARDEYADAAVDAVEGLTEEDFTVYAHKVVLRSMKNLNSIGSPLDLLTLAADIEARGELDKVGGFAYLAETSKDVPSLRNLSVYVQKLKDFTMARNMIQMLNDGVQKLTEPSAESLQDIIGAIQSNISTIEAESDAGTRHIIDGIEMAIDNVEAIINGEIWKYRTLLGMEDIDRAFGGFNNTDFIVVGGRPGMGKTMFSTTATETIALKRKKPVLFFSLEMPIEQISERIAFHRARVSKEGLLGKEGKNMDAEWAKVGSCLKEFVDAPIHINDKPSLSIHQIRAESRRMHKKLGGLGVVVIDYLQKMKMTNPENMNQSVGEIATGLKNLAKELRCPVIALAQLNRKVEERANKRPVNSDLRESGVIEQEADVIFMVYRDEKYNPQTELKGITEIICTKSRHAPGAEKTYYFNNQHSGLDPAAFNRSEYQQDEYDVEC